MVNVYKKGVIYAVRYRAFEKGFEKLLRISDIWRISLKSGLKIGLSMLIPRFLIIQKDLKSRLAYVLLNL